MEVVHNSYRKRALYVFAFTVIMTKKRDIVTDSLEGPLITQLAIDLAKSGYWPYKI